MPDLIVKRFDTYPPVTAVLSDVNGPIDLTAASSVKFIMKGQQQSTVVTGTCAISSPANAGQVQYFWVSGNTSVADTYGVEFEITWQAGGKQTVPNSSVQNPTIEVDSDLNAA